MARKRDEDINVLPNALGLMYFEEKTNSKITIDGEAFKKVLIALAVFLYLAFAIYGVLL